MVGNKITQSRPHTMMIRKLSELLVPGGGNYRPVSGFSSDATTSPRSPLDYPKTQSPKGLKNFDLGGVGLGIVAALEKSSTADAGYEVLAKHSVCCTPKSDPIPVGSGRARCWRKDEKIIESSREIEILENYTYVTSRSGGGGGKPCTKVYYDGGEIIGRAPEEFPGPAAESLLEEEESGYPSSSFLNCCHLCKKQLQGLDIYMYRGETAFCSSECRWSQMMMDEQQEKQQKQMQKKNKCRREVGRSVDMTVSGKSSSSSSPAPMFSTGILAI